MNQRVTTIRRRLMTDLVLLIVLTGGTILAATWITGKRTVEELSTSLIDRTTRRTENELQHFFGTVQSQVLIGRDWAEYGILDATDYEAMNRLFVPILQQHPQMSSMMVADSAGAEYLLLRDPVELNKWSNRVVQADALGKRVFYHDWNSDTGEVSRHEFDTLDYDPRRRIWYEQALLTTEEKPVFWTKPVIFFITKDPGITVSTHLVRESETPQTIVVAYDLLLMDITRFTTKQQVSQRGKTFVLIENQEAGTFQVVGLPRDKRYTDGHSILEALLYKPNSSVADADAELPAPESLQIAELTAAMQAWESSGRLTRPLRYKAVGEQWWGGLRPYRLGENTFWIGVVVPEQDLSGGIRLQQLVLMSIVLGVLIIGAIRAVSLARRFSAPIESLVDQSERISEGDLDPGDPISSDVGEIRRLAEAHDNMREGLKSVIKLEKLERDLDIARDIQKGLLPETPPETPGFQVAGWNRPADKTGGDYFDWLTLPDERTLFTLADVSGHGIGPALIVSVYRAYMRASADDSQGALSAVAGRLNDLLCDDIPEGRFITAAIGLIKPEEFQVELLSAGQAPLLYYEAASETLHNWEADDLPLGIASGVEFAEARQIHFGPGDMLLLTTDGFFEAANHADEQFGIQALEQFMRDHHHLPPDEFIRQLYRQVKTHADGAAQGDDLTALVIKRSENL